MVVSWLRPVCSDGCDPMSRPGQALTDALLKMADEGQRPRCGDWNDNNPWLAEDPRLRALAAWWCDGCPIVAACAQAGKEMKVSFGVWGGQDLTKQGRKAAS